MEKVKENTDSMAFGDCTFQITTANEIRLKALCKYAEMLDYVTNAEEQACVDGLINSLLEQAMVKRIGELYKKHGFDSAQDFIDQLNACKDGEEVRHEVQEAEKISYQKAHDEILSHVPIPDTQTKFDFAK